MVDVVVCTDSENEKDHVKAEAGQFAAKRSTLDARAVPSSAPWVRINYIYLLTFSAAFIGMLAYLQLKVIINSPISPFCQFLVSDLSWQPRLRLVAMKPESRIHDCNPMWFNFRGTDSSERFPLDIHWSTTNNAGQTRR